MTGAVAGVAAGGLACVSAGMAGACAAGAGGAVAPWVVVVVWLLCDHAMPVAINATIVR